MTPSDELLAVYNAAQPAIAEQKKTKEANRIILLQSLQDGNTTIYNEICKRIFDAAKTGANHIIINFFEEFYDDYSKINFDAVSTITEGIYNELRETLNVAVTFDVAGDTHIIWDTEAYYKELKQSFIASAYCAAMNGDWKTRQDKSIISDIKEALENII